ncbi:hypothetical protein CK203_020041 [Vitis vinifera]|uniref:Uncharacterized protein n=1 Tax=Vitis vinifera TaxID=29760 RepID=A0A438J8C1_VITVI|nr:hypothetical protein CK203_020041 [Vitis vinifera]
MKAISFNNCKEHIAKPWEDGIFKVGSNRPKNPTFALSRQQLIVCLLLLQKSVGSVDTHHVLDYVLLLDTHDQLFIVKALLKLVADKQLQIFETAGKYRTEALVTIRRLNTASVEKGSSTHWFTGQLLLMVFPDKELQKLMRI